MAEQTLPPAAIFKAALDIRELGRGDPNNPFLHFLHHCMVNAPWSCAQLFQDLFVQFTLAGKRNGYFVEFGATNGIDASNTLLLERQFAWTGILAEPACCWHSALAQNRTAKIDHRCVWKKSGEILTFNETEPPDLSTIDSFTASDYHDENRRMRQRYDVESVSLNDLLGFHEAPRAIDYLSVDTEGSELEILGSFDFDRYDVSIITVEHNFLSGLREGIHGLLTSKGYDRVCVQVSGWDDWYVNPRLLQQARAP